MFHQIHRPHRGLKRGVLATCLGLALIAAATAAADPVQPITVGPITVGNGTVSAIAGTNGTNSNATILINGQAATIDANGNISAAIDLTGRSSVTLTTENPATGQTASTTIPISLLGPGGVIPASALDMLRQAGVTIAVPTGGFTALPGQPLQVSGTVANPSLLAGLTVNGVDALSLVKPDGTFTVPVTGTGKTVGVTATDAQGSSESSSYKITQLAAPKGQSTSSGSTSVAAASASGVVITGVRYTTKNVKKTKRLSVMLTVKDTHGLLVRGAKVRFRATSFQHNFVVGSQATKVTNGQGRATFVVKLRVAKFNQSRRLFTVETALTPSASTTRTTSVRLPKLTAAHKH